MTTTSSTTASATTATTAASSSASSLSATSAKDASDRFLKLLVTQMQNQDPLNPVDNAQVTSQMAQISTVTGLETLNTTVSGLNSQFLQLQTMQGAALVGHDVALEGNTLRQTSSPTGTVGDAGFELGSAADKVTVDILNASGVTVGTVNLGNQTAGRHAFEWTVPDSLQGEALSFKVTATAAGKAVESMSLQHERVSAVSTVNNTLALELAGGSRVPATDVWAYL